ncbi:peptidylprolyl isomerase, partial [Sinorhizobium meliloti]
MMMGGKNAIVRLLSAVALAGALSVAAGTVTTAMA